MASVHKFNEAMAGIRGVPLGTIEAYSRVLRREHVLPKTKRGGAAEPLTTKMAAYILVAVMRGSPSAAAENARETGDLIVHSSGGALLEPVLQRQLKALAWPDDMSFAGAVAWLIDRYVDGTISEYAVDGTGIKVEIDRYWTTASLQWHPTPRIVEEYIAGWREGLGDKSPAVPERTLDGKLLRPMEIGFHTPLLHEAKISYGVSKARNREAHRKYREMKEQAERFDRWGSESFTHKTLIAIAEVFK